MRCDRNPGVERFDSLAGFWFCSDTHTHTFPPDYSARWAKNKVHELASHMPQCCVLMTSTEFLAWRYNGFAKNRAAAPPSGTEPKHTANMSYIYDHHRWGIYFHPPANLATSF